MWELWFILYHSLHYFNWMRDFERSRRKSQRMSPRSFSSSSHTLTTHTHTHTHILKHIQVHIEIKIRGWESKTQASVDIEEFADDRLGFLGMAAELRRQKRQKEEKNEAEKRKLFWSCFMEEKVLRRRGLLRFLTRRCVRRSLPFRIRRTGRTRRNEISRRDRRRQELLRRKRGAKEEGKRI